MTIVSALCLGLLLSSAALADQALAPVVVPLPPPEDLSAPTERDATGAISIVHARGKSGEHVDTAQLLRALPGLTVRESSGVGQTQMISVRGAQAQGVRVELDGIPLNGAGGIADLSTVPLSFVDTLALARGASGARYGFGALGGVLEIETVRPDQAPQAAARLTGGSFGTALADLSATGPLFGGSALLLVHGQRSSGDFAFPYDPLPSIPTNALETRVRQNNASRLGGGLFELRRRFGGWDTEALADLTTLSRGLAGTAVNPTPGLSESLTRWLLGVRAHCDFGGTELFLRGWGDLEGSELDSPLSPGLAQTFDTAGAEASLRAFLGDHLVQATLEGGGEWLFGPGTYRRGRLALMTGDDWLLFGRLTLSPSLRYERVGGLGGFSPKLGASLALSHGFALRANAGLTFRAPSFLELYVVQGTLMPNPRLSPERGRSIDAAVSWSDSRARASLGGFATDYEDLIRYELYGPFLATPYNFDGARVYGLELEAGFREGLLEASASYTLTRSADLRDDVRFYGKELPYEPRHQLEARLSVGTDRLKGTAELTARSRQYTNRAQTLWIDPSARLDLSGSVRLTRAPKVSLVLLLENAFDAHTLAFDGYPLPGRALYATVEVALGGEGRP